MSMLDQKQMALPARTHLVPRDLLASPPVLRASDGLGKAVRKFVEVGTGVLPVVEGDRLVGVLLESDVVAPLVSFTGSDLAGNEPRVLHLMRLRPLVVRDDEPLENLLSLFESRGYQAVPVLDASEHYQGMLTRASVVAALTKNLRPARIGGMATPMGVYLTTGHVSAGVGFRGLFLSGAALAGVNWLIELAVMHTEQLTHISLPEWQETLAAFILFLVVLRLSPLAGFHAAEHQTVNAIEAGEELDLDLIGKQPREHSRCGTNLMALLFGVQLLLPWLAYEPFLVLPVGLVGFLVWRKVGFALQRFFTTKPPTRAQLENGRNAGIALLKAYAVQPGLRVDRAQRIWNMGLVQILAGAFTVLGLLEAAYQFFPVTRGILF
jgi:CBS domain-containing protein